MGEGGVLFTSTGGLATDVSILLVACLLLTFTFTATQLVRIINHSSTSGLAYKCIWWFFPWTVQKQVHALILLSTAARVAFLFVGSYVWDMTSGAIVTDSQGLRMAFYLLDELPLILFFSIALVLASFWAKVHYDAEDEASLYETVVSAALNWLHVAAYVGLAINWTLYATIWEDFDLYIEEAVAYYMSVVYVVSGGLLLWYARLTVEGVSQVPIEVQVRKRKLREIWGTSIVVAVAMVVRVCVVLDVAGMALPTTDWFDWLVVLLYILLVEVAPLLAILYYFHRMPSATTLDWGGVGYEDKLALSWLLGGGSKEMMNPDKVSAEMIENSIRRLSTLHTRRQGGGGTSSQGGGIGGDVA